jgi:urease accessory protein
VSTSDWSVPISHGVCSQPHRPFHLQAPRVMIANEGDDNAPVADETYILLLLADSSLPTGSFVASSGFESYLKHGFTSTIDFVRDGLQNYAHTSLPFVSETHRLVHMFRTGGVGDILNSIVLLDIKYDEITLNHVARRASKSQGVALLTLYTKAFSSASLIVPASEANHDNIKLESIIDGLKSLVRKEETHGHLPICWGVLTAALGLTLGLSSPSFTTHVRSTNRDHLTERAQYLHLFLHARSVLSAAVRLNTIGPYAAQTFLLHLVRPLIDHEARCCRSLPVEPTTDEGDMAHHGAATTWPLGEILATRHDLQHSRIFNS